MTETLVTLEGPLRRGTILDRPNRFVLEVEFDNGGREQVYISNTGSWNVTEEGRPVLVRDAEGDSRKTDYDAVAVKADGVWVSVDATFANKAFETALRKGLLPVFAGYEVIRSEPHLPSGGRADFALAKPSDETALVEVKSCTLVEDGIAMFPDRQTARGRRHLEELIDLKNDGTETHVVFVVQRADGEYFTPNATVDPGLADLVAEAERAGVGIHAMQLAIEPPVVSIERPSMPVKMESPSDW